VVCGYQKATFSFVEANSSKPDLGKHCQITVGDLTNIVFCSSDPTIDVGLIFLNPILECFRAQGKTPFFVSLDARMIPTRQQEADIEAIQQIVFVGYPNGMRDNVNLLPIARRGYTATPYAVDFNGLPLFLIDANVFQGSSGSPVLVLDDGPFASRGGLVVGQRAYFLGLVTSAYFQPVDGEIQFKQVPTQFVAVSKEQRYLNLGGVVKAKAIENTISECLKHYSVPQSVPTNSATTNNITPR
jgi:hypothetical protein